MAGTALNGSASLSAVDISKAPADVDPTELKALRNRVNRADGGIGRKLTLDVLKLQCSLKPRRRSARCRRSSPRLCVAVRRRRPWRRDPQPPGKHAGRSWGAEGDREDRAGAAMEVNGGDVDGGWTLGRTCS
eukprot:jgi/Ulvmu1/11289/UM074_0004.1